VANALVRLRTDGRTTVLVGTSEIGQGARTVFSQIVSDVLSVDMDDVSVLGADTSVVPYDRSTGASRSTTLVGLAVQRACEDVVAQLTRVAARRWPEAACVRERDGRYVGVTASGEECGDASLQEVLAMLGASGDAVIGRGRVGLEGDPAGFPVFWEACAAAATVALDDATGTVSVLDVATSPDVGRALNPLLVAVQDAGCTLQALGQTLYEELEFSPQGELVTPSLVQYFVPTFEEAPDRASCNPVAGPQDGTTGWPCRWQPRASP
jgi:CO/xanthine dehydrogenase Mo-binding subunit